jgi:hypothetical protein
VTRAAWIRSLTTVGNVLGAAVIVFGIATFVRDGALAGLLIAIAIIIVGPGEDVLQAWVRRTATDPAVGEELAEIVDRATSVAFLVLLGLTLVLR